MAPAAHPLIAPCLSFLLHSGVRWQGRTLVPHPWQIAGGRRWIGVWEGRVAEKLVIPDRGQLLLFLETPPWFFTVVGLSISFLLSVLFMWYWLNWSVIDLLNGSSVLAWGRYSPHLLGQLVVNKPPNSRGRMSPNSPLLPLQMRISRPRLVFVLFPSHRLNWFLVCQIEVLIPSKLKWLPLGRSLFQL